MAEIVDAHHHLWRFSESEYGWIAEDLKALRRDFLPVDLSAAMASSGVYGSVAVQARQSLEETEFLLECADEAPFILGVVGWVPLAAENLPEVLKSLAPKAKLKGVRHVVQDEPDEHFILSESFNRGVAALLDTGLAYDILIYDRHLPQALRFVQKHPQQRFVLDHLGKPKIAAGQLEPWRSDLMRLADCPNVFCKVSGMVTEADWKSWSPDGLLPYLNTALAAFGADRLMAGSDWPVCLAASSYARWWSTLFDWAQTLPSEQRESFLGGTAQAFYRLEIKETSAGPGTLD